MKRTNRKQQMFLIITIKRTNISRCTFSILFVIYVRYIQMYIVMRLEKSEKRFFFN